MRASTLCFITTLLLGQALAFAEDTVPAVANEPAIEEPYQSLRTELIQILLDDQKYRKQIEEIGVINSMSTERNRELLAKMIEVDAANLIKVNFILEQHGWLGPDKVGKEASEALFLAIQHGDLATQQKYLPMVRQAVKDKTLSSQSLPLLEDRVALKSRRRQIYGTQIGNGEAMGVRNYVSPLEDPDNVDKRRKEVGLGPIAEYVKRWGITWDVEEYKKLLPEIEIAEQNNDLKVELLIILVEDQKYRKQLEEYEKKYGQDSKEMAALWDRIEKADASNLSKVRVILTTHGWLGPEDVGNEASDALFLVIQHADLKTQQKYLPVMRAAFKEGKAPADSLALLEDRIAIREGRRQVYGSQIGFNKVTKQHYIQPLDDPDNVDKRRASAGLDPLAYYVKHWGITWDVETYKKTLPELEKYEKASPTE